MTHYVEICEYGYLHGQCRCPDDDKIVKRVKCTNTAHQVDEAKRRKLNNIIYDLESLSGKYTLMYLQGLGMESRGDIEGGNAGRVLGLVYEDIYEIAKELRHALDLYR